MSTWVLRCSVCNEDYEGYSEWLRHLRGRHHQALARTECEQWTKDVKECVIVSYSSIPVADYAQEILRQISSETNGTFVTDFILWVDRPKVAFIQLESKEAVEQVFTNGSPVAEIQLETFSIQVKRAVDMIEFEWKEFFPDLRTTKTTNSNQNQSLDTRKRWMPEDVTDKRKRSLSPLPSSKRNRIVDRSPPPSASTRANKQLMIQPILPPSPASSRGRVDKMANLSIKAQYWVIQGETAIPETELKKVENLLGDLRSIARKSFPLSNVYLFRHWYLQIKNCGTNQLFVFLDTIGIWSKPWPANIEDASCSSLKGKCKNNEDTIAWLLAAHKDIETLSNGTKLPREIDPLGTPYFHKLLGVQFNVVTSLCWILEVQACRLLKYLTKFDPRVTPLLSLISYWAKLNNVCFSQSSVSTTDCVNAFQGVEPMTLDWLVISFLCHQKIIPSPRMILESDHETLMFQNYDIGFSENEEFSEKWKRSHHPPSENSDEFTISLFALACDFFKFYARFAQISYILNTKDGEWISGKDLFSRKKLQTKLTADECELVKSSMPKGVAEIKIRILHPLQVSKYLSLDYRNFLTVVQSLFKETSRKLQKFKAMAPPLNDTVNLNVALYCSRR